MATRKLTPKQQRFVDEYLIDSNATQAAIRAGYSKRTAPEIGRQNLMKLDIKEAIAKRQKKRSERTEITQDRVLLEVARLAFSDGRKAFDEHNRLKPISQWDDDFGAAVSSIEVVTKDAGGGEVEYVHKIKLWDKNAALQKTMQHLGMFEKDNRQKNPLGGLSDEQLAERIKYLAEQFSR